jgi:hypothetical protein
MLPGSFKQLEQHQRVGMIAGMRTILWTKDAMCNTITDIDTLPAWQNAAGTFKYTIPCYVLPRDMPRLVKSMQEKQNKGERYMVKPLDHGEGHGIFVATSIEEITSAQNEWMKSSKRLVQPFIADPHLINGKKYVGAVWRLS